MADPDVVAAFGKEKYILLTTFRRSGVGVATPVWFAFRNDRLVAFTGAQTGKARRLAHDPRVTVQACTFRGTGHGVILSGSARTLPDSDRDEIMKKIRRKYRVSQPLLAFVVWSIRTVRRRPQTRTVYLEIALGEPVSAPL